MTLSTNPLDLSAYRLFGKYAYRNRQTYFDLEQYLRKANYSVPVDIYIARTLFMATFSAVTVSMLCFTTALFFTLRSATGTLLPWAVSETANPALRAVTSGPFLLFLILAMSFLATFVGAYMFYRNYPVYRAGVRENNIDQMLPHAVTFMYAMSSGGMNLMDIFRILYQHRDIYGEVAVDVQAVVRGVDMLGLDLITSLKQASKITPSDHLKNFFESTATSLESGGDLSTFLRSRSDQFQVIAVQERKSLLEMLSMLAEVYVTAFVAGPLFMITILISMGLMSSGNGGQLEFLIYVLVPVGSILFLWLLILMGLESSDSKIIRARQKLEEFGEVKKVEQQSRATGKMRMAEVRFKIRKFIENPAASFLNYPQQVFLFTVPVGAFVFVFFAYQYYILPYYHMISRMDDILLLGLAIIFIPFIICWEIRAWRIRKMDAAIPEFLKRLASFNESGLTLAQAIKSLLNSNLGILNTEIRKIWSDIEWGADAKEALIRFEYRVNTASIRRVVTLITKASESSGDIQETLSIAAADAASSQTEKEDRFLNMLLYISIIYISFFVFIYIIYTLSTVFLPAVPGVSITSQISTDVSLNQAFTGRSVDTQMYRLIFFHAVIIQGIFSGLVAGMMGEGNFYAGLKHAAIMTAIGYVVFLLFI